VWFTNPVGTDLVLSNLLKKKKHNLRKLTRYDHAQLLLKDHKLKMKILPCDYMIKKKKAEALGITLMSEFEESSDDN
jgi:hypothetical protein